MKLALEDGAIVASAARAAPRAGAGSRRWSRRSDILRGVEFRLAPSKPSGPQIIPGRNRLIQLLFCFPVGVINLPRMGCAKGSDVFLR